ncbi:restriction endonuclease subunit S [Enterobacter hormaechei]|uniref:restriction endonuclease subunit S n=1 Tax=Enterobacter hormaechei TaxID=158836 RepID=UPI002FEF1152
MTLKWEKVRLGDVAELQRGFDLPSTKRIEGEIPIVSSSGITGFHVEAKAKAPGVVTGRYGSIGDVFYLEQDFWPLNTSLWVKDFHGNDEKFIYFLLSNFDFKKFSDKTGVPGVNRNDLHAVNVLLPPLSEQKKIAQILSTWDKAISVTEKLLTNSQQQKKALMQQLLTGKKRLLDERGVRFSGEWGKFTLSHFGKCIRGVSYKPENICENESDNTIRLLRSTNIQNGELNDKDLIILPKKLVKPMQVLMDGDLAICMANGSKSLVGKSAPYKPNDADYTVGAFCALFRPLKSVSSSFVKFLFESNQYQSQLLVILAGSSINNLKGSDIESINIDAPLHYKEQQKIAAVLSAADAEISTLEKKLACLRDEKKALMQQLLTGKRRVKVDEAVAV